MVTCLNERFRPPPAPARLLAERAGPRPITVGADKGYGTGDFVMQLRQLGAVPHVAQHTTGRRSAIDRRTTRHAGYHLSQRARYSSTMDEFAHSNGGLLLIPVPRRFHLRGARPPLANPGAQSRRKDQNLLRLVLDRR
jgi:hypothetical protein